MLCCRGCQICCLNLHTCPTRPPLSIYRLFFIIGMESGSLQSASIYLNNLLLARGLLKNGKSIEFARPKNDAASGTDETMSQIINLVHDLVLRRDRDMDQRENLVANLQAVRAEEKQYRLETKQAQDNSADLMRRLSTAEAQERTLRANARKAEIQARELKEQMLKMKSMLDQVRAKCLSDVRKKDNEIQRLKDHLSSLKRGRHEGSVMKSNINNGPPSLSRPQVVPGTQDANGEEWSLEKETNEVLAALVNETSTENVALRQIVQKATLTLRHLTGLEPEQSRGVNDQLETGIGIPGQDRRPGRKISEDHPTGPLVGCDMLAADMNTALDHCKSILKDPSFVPIEEVQVREEEIIKLREGWEKMATRWKEAVMMMDTWRRRMLDGGESVDLQELSNLDFGRSVAVLPNGEPILAREISDVPLDGMKGELNCNHDDGWGRKVSYEILSSSNSEDEWDVGIHYDLSPKRLASSPARRGLKLARPGNPLLEVSGNAASNKPKSDHVTFNSSAACHVDTSDCTAEKENEEVREGLRAGISRLVSLENAAHVKRWQAHASIENKNPSTGDDSCRKACSNRGGGQGGRISAKTRDDTETKTRPISELA